MSIDLLSLPVPSQAAGASEVKGNKGKSGAASATSDGSPAAFSDILADVDSPESDEAVDAKEGSAQTKDAVVGDEVKTAPPTDTLWNAAPASLPERVDLHLNASQLSQVGPETALSGAVPVSRDEGSNQPSVELPSTVAVYATANPTSEVSTQKKFPLGDSVVDSFKATSSVSTQGAVELSLPDGLDVSPKPELLTSSLQGKFGGESLPAKIELLVQQVMDRTKSSAEGKDASTAVSATSVTFRDLDVTPPATTMSRPRQTALPQVVMNTVKEPDPLPATESLQKASLARMQSTTSELLANYADTLSAGKLSEAVTDARKIDLYQFSTGTVASTMRPLESLLPLGQATRSGEQPRPHSIFSRDPSEILQSPQSMVVGGSSPTTTAVASMAPSTEVFVAQQVSYWISRDVQKAELKLDGFGSEAVQVNISMNGNEAQVMFRTDDLQTRAVLENASTHLKDMLQREGVVLSGVSVGTNSPGDSDRQDRRPRQGVRQASVGMTQPLQSTMRREPALATGRSLDLFV